MRRFAGERLVQQKTACVYSSSPVHAFSDGRDEVMPVINVRPPRFARAEMSSTPTRARIALAHTGGIGTSPLSKSPTARDGRQQDAPTHQPKGTAFNGRKRMSAAAETLQRHHEIHHSIRTASP